MDDVTLRCQKCAARHDRQAPVLAVLHGAVLLAPLRIGKRKAAQMGVARSGMFWRRIPVVDGHAVLVCPRCHDRSRVRPADYVASSATIASAARAAALPSRNA